MEIAMAPSKIDTLIAALSDFSQAVGEFRTGIKNLEKRAAEDRDERARDHAENQKAIGDLRNDMQAANSELRQSAVERWNGAAMSIEGLSKKLDDHAKTVSALQIGRARLLILASIGVFALTVVGWAAQEGVKWIITFSVKKFGGP